MQPGGSTVRRAALAIQHPEGGGQILLILKFLSCMCPESCSLCAEGVFVSSCCVTSFHKSTGLKEHLFLTAQFTRPGKVWLCPQPGSHQLKQALTWGSAPPSPLVRRIQLLKVKGEGVGVPAVPLATGWGPLTASGDHHQPSPCGPLHLNKTMLLRRPSLASNL